MENKKPPKYRRLSADDMIFISENAGKLTDTDIAIKLGCSPSGISRARQRLSLIKKGHRLEIPQDRIEPPPDSAEQELCKYYKDKLTHSSRGERLCRILDRSEWDFFRDEWISFHVQIPDLTHTEDNNIEEIVILRLRMQDNMSQYNKYKKERVEAESELLKMDQNDAAMGLAMVKVQQLDGRLIDLNREYDKLLERSNSLQKTLNATREQREKQGKVGADTFFTLCKQFENRNHRRKEGRMAELLRLATEKNTNKLRQAIQFVDGQIEPQLLDAETIKQMKDQEQTETNKDKEAKIENE